MCTTNESQLHEESYHASNLERLFARVAVSYTALDRNMPQRVQRDSFTGLNGNVAETPAS